MMGELISLADHRARRTIAHTHRENADRVDSLSAAYRLLCTLKPLCVEEADEDPLERIFRHADERTAFWAAQKREM